MCPAIENPTSCKVSTIAQFLHTKNKSATEIHRELYVVYGQNVMYEGTVRQWC
jgi:hypothetical protein